MKKSLPSKIPEFKNDYEIAAFMEKYSGFDLLDKGLASIIATSSFVRPRKGVKALLKDKRVKIAFKDEGSLQKILSPSILSSRTFRVIDTDLSGILLSLPEVPASEGFYVPYLNISGITVLSGLKKIPKTKSF